jgi:hypothetical protein
LLQQRHEEVTMKPKRRTILLILGGMVLVVATFFAIKAYIEAPRDLGPDLVYIGRENYGNILGFDQAPGSNYFFATSMTKDQLIAYITKLGYVYDSEHSGSVGGHAGLVFSANNGAGFDLNYYDSVNTVSEVDGVDLKNTDKKPFIVKVADYEYPKLKQALERASKLK